MQPVSPVIPDKNFNEIVVAEHQDEYQNLPAIPLEGGMILTRWKLDEAERRRVAETGDIYVSMMTFGNPVTPLLLTVEPPHITMPTPVQMMTACRRSEQIIEKARTYGLEIFEDNCSDCGFAVVFTRATIETVANAPELKIICTECFKAAQAANPDLSDVYLPNTHGEMGRIVDVLKRQSHDEKENV